MEGKFSTNQYMHLYLDAQKLNYDEFKSKYCIDTSNYVCYEIEKKVKKKGEIESYFEDGILEKHIYEYILDKLANKHYINLEINNCTTNYNYYKAKIKIDDIKFNNENGYIENYILKENPFSCGPGDKNDLALNLSKCKPNCKCNIVRVVNIKPYYDSDTEIE